jgi:hypothetical protein
MYLAGFEPTISAGERPQTHALYRAATGIGAYSPYCNVLKTNGLDPNEIHVVCHLQILCTDASNSDIDLLRFTPHVM